MLPARHRAFVNGLAHLGHAGGLHQARVLVKVQAVGIPRQAHKLQHPAGLGFGVGHHVLVGQIQNAAGRQHLVPMAHQRHVTCVVAPQRALVVGKLHCVVEQAGKARKARIHRVAHGVDDLGTRQGQVNQPQIEEVGRHLVGDEGALGRELPHPLQVVVPQSPQVGLGQRSDTCGKWLPCASLGLRCIGDGRIQIHQLARPINRRVAAQNLLQQRGARAGHTHNKDGGAFGIHRALPSASRCKKRSSKQRLYLR